LSADFAQLVPQSGAGTASGDSGTGFSKATDTTTLHDTLAALLHHQG